MWYPEPKGNDPDPEPKDKDPEPGVEPKSNEAAPCGELTPEGVKFVNSLAAEADKRGGLQVLFSQIDAAAKEEKTAL